VWCARVCVRKRVSYVVYMSVSVAVTLIHITIFSDIWISLKLELRT